MYSEKHKYKKKPMLLNSKRVNKKLTNDNVNKIMTPFKSLKMELSLLYRDYA